MNTHDSHRARKRFGQNFLHDANVIHRIINAINPQTGDRIVEIGPGLGAITQHLLDAAGSLDVVELDRDLVTQLEKNFADHNIRIHSGDALRFDFCTLAQPTEKLRIVGNLPYNISTPLLFHLMDQLSCIRDIHCMLQKEVVDRLAAEPNSDDYGRLSVMIQYHCEVAKLFDVGPESFSPAPKVDSAVARLRPHAQKPVSVTDETIFSKIVAQAFSQRRKTLRNALKLWLTAEEMEPLGIDSSRRPETLSLKEFADLSNLATQKQRAV
ncbi:MAG: 16S rRNA (adenine(1518)-N(6)/adenine(1519)-N(6))-dimethyltransferase RsmA [Gammaproteobacteria bacterium]|nr:16S rRNA (adenine(1518)-N(6)/adenine(1519)-N(6))-dimethyltransferase RsmA [Gammaproteobacteria bacterium]